MIGRLALRSLTAHPIRSAVLAAGFGAGVGVMAILLGVAEIVLTQARSPDLVGGGDVVINLEPTVPARLVMSGTLQSNQLRNRVRAAGPSHSFRNLPVIIAGSAGGYLKQGQFIDGVASNNGKLLTTLITAAGGRSNGAAYTSFASAGAVLSQIVA